MFFETLIDKSSLNRYTAFIPKIYRESLKNDELRGTAVYNDYADPKHFVGVVLFRELFMWQQIVWVGLSARYPFAEYASDLITMRSEAACASGSLYGTYASFGPDETDTESRFDKAGFLVTQKIGNTYEFTLDQVVTGSSISRSNLREAKAFSLLEAEEIDKLSELLNESTDPIPKPIKLDEIEDNVSAVVIKDGEVKSYVLCRYSNQALTILGVHAAEPKDIDILFTHIYFTSARKYGRELRILVPTVDDALTELVKKFAPEAKLYQVKIAYYPYSGERKLINPEKTGLDDGEAGDKANDELAGIAGSYAYLLNDSSLEISKIYRREIMGSDEAGDRLGLGGIYYLTNSDRGPASARCAENIYSNMFAPGNARFGEELFSTVEFRRERALREKEKDPFEKLRTDAAAGALAKYRAGEKNEAGLDGMEFIIKPAFGPEDDRGALGILSALLTRNELVKKKRTGKTAAEKAEEEYEDALGTLLERIIKVYFGMLGISDDQDAKISEEKKEEYRNLFPGVCERYIGLVSEKKVKVARGILKRVSDSEEYKKEYSKAFTEVLSKEENKSDDSKEHDMLMRKRAGMEASLLAASRLPEFADEETFECLKKSFEEEITLAKYLEKNYDAGNKKCQDVDPTKPIEKTIESYAPELSDMAEWDKDGGGVVRTIVNYAIRNELPGYERPENIKERTLEELYSILMGLKEKYTEIFEPLVLGDMFKHLDKLAEAFFIAWEIRHVSLAYGVIGDSISDEYRLSDEKCKTVDELYLSLLKRGCGINYFGSKTYNEIMGKE